MSILQQYDTKQNGLHVSKFFEDNGARYDLWWRDHQTTEKQYFYRTINDEGFRAESKNWIDAIEILVLGYLASTDTEPEHLKLDVTNMFHKNMEFTLRSETTLLSWRGGLACTNSF